jgi:hypothetical protein
MNTSPRIAKAALVSLDPFGPPQLIMFQYNPERVSRTLQAQSSGPGGARSEALRLDGPPTESLQFQEVALDAADQLERRDTIAEAVGVLPQLAALEMLLYPRSAAVIANTVLLAAGTLEILAPESPLTVLIWGRHRIVPVRLTEYSVNEEAFDASLNPIRATLSLGLRVLSYGDLPLTHPGYYLFLSHQIGKEVLAAVATVNDAQAVAHRLGGSDASAGRATGGGLTET